MNEMLENGVELMLIGMGIVFLFLTLLVVAIKVMSSLITRFFPEPIAVPPPIPSLVAKKKPIDSGVIAAISAAVHHYKKQHSQQ
ncbi:MAG: OadG family transporter subunit [Methylicorpusculum sp.]|nr:OadG family transporter subunit [Methylicorpusculum sp.]MDO8845149.1 OadG family transporter subunit [Methylicorpusculum sp.]MDO8938894.1 OadG family transporter subunit [Methylicorpusculum sp.]MDO9239260.1 OadG family transporter subunit [Methylicorpusculum sp.]MDP2177994.1 OadG family transporter subunit [Methylicorpusculum sp.]MDP2204651.1 OadG family transporter subunit [Methylicorpusculum sp.]